MTDFLKIHLKLSFKSVNERDISLIQLANCAMLLASKSANTTDVSCAVNVLAPFVLQSGPIQI